MVESQNLDTVPTVPSTKSRIWYDIEQGSLRKLTPFDFIEPDTVQKLYNSLILQAKSCYERRHLIIDEIERSSSLYNTKDQLKKSIEILADQSQRAGCPDWWRRHSGSRGHWGRRRAGRCSHAALPAHWRLRQG